MTHKVIPNNLGKFTFSIRLHLSKAFSATKLPSLPPASDEAQHFFPEEAGLKDGDTLNLSKSLTSGFFQGSWEVGDALFVANKIRDFSKSFTVSF